MAQVKFETLRTLAEGSISDTYAAVGGPLENKCRMFRLINNTDGDMFFSDDGINDMLFVPASSFVLYDLTANSGVTPSSDNFLLSFNTQFYVRESSSPSKGAVYIEVIYAFGGN